MKKELLTIEFRYCDKPQGDYDTGDKSKTITIGIFDTIEEGVIEGNKVLAILSKTFEVRAKDKFEVIGLFGYPNRLVTNTCYPTKGIQYFAKITPLDFMDLSEMVDETFSALDRYEKHEVLEQN